LFTSKHKLTIVVPTKDRPNQLRRMLESLGLQSSLPDQVVVVASGSEESREVVNQFSSLNIQYIHLSRAGTSWQRNAGLKVVDPASTLVGFLDDDIVLEPDALEAMLAFWEEAPADVGGAGFNFRDILVPETERKWKLRPIIWLYNAFMLRNERKGRVLRSGFPTPIFPVSENTYTDWLEALFVFRKEVTERFQFDDFFAGYSYLEQVDFSYTVSRKYKLCVVCDARMTHYSDHIRNSYLLGKMQVINRIHFVRKHEELSSPRCYFTLMLHMFFNVAVGVLLRDMGYFKRAWGNCVGLCQVAVGRMAPVAGDIK
jgi:glycosyltransferase involved in cell wall biosynthesis